MKKPHLRLVPAAKKKQRAQSSNVVSLTTDPLGRLLQRSRETDTTLLDQRLFALQLAKAVAKSVRNHGDVIIHLVVRLNRLARTCAQLRKELSGLKKRCVRR
jgi:hypothetical protein